MLSVFVINMAPECLLVHHGHIAALISHSVTFSNLYYFSVFESINKVWDFTQHPLYLSSTRLGHFDWHQTQLMVTKVENGPKC